LRSKIFILIFSALFLVLCGWLYSRQGVLRLASLEIESTTDSDLILSVKRKIAPFLGANLLALSLEDLQKSLQENPRIKKVSIRRKPPSTISIKITERLPVAVYIEKGKQKVIGDEGGEIYGFATQEKLPIWVRFARASTQNKSLVAKWLAELRVDYPEYFYRISEFEWVKNRGLVISVQSKPVPEGTAASYIQVDMGTVDFVTKWQRLKLVLDWMLEQQVHGERLIALADGQVVISGVKNLHNLKNELNLKEIVRRATPQSDTRVQAR
jgi:hypothetical protein